jgi:hypothetical protein
MTNTDYFTVLFEKRLDLRHRRHVTDLSIMNGTMLLCSDSNAALSFGPALLQFSRNTESANIGGGVVVERRMPRVYRGSHRRRPPTCSKLGRGDH